jgi:hypothetical protein
MPKCRTGTGRQTNADAGTSPVQNKGSQSGTDILRYWTGLDLDAGIPMPADSASMPMASASMPMPTYAVMIMKQKSFQIEKIMFLQI